MKPAGLFVLLLAATAALPAVAQDAEAVRARQYARENYLLHCAGCHRPDGSGRTRQGIPDFRNSVGWFTTLPEGREYLVRVPGAAQSQLSDEQLAQVLNWMLRAFSPNQPATGFRPFTREEVAAVRDHRFDDVVPVRRAIERRLRSKGHTLAKYTYGADRADALP